jgi:hypothetical protein
MGPQILGQGGGCILDFASNTFCIYILALLYLHSQVRTTSRWGHKLYFVTGSRNVLNWTRSYLIVGIETNISEVKDLAKH